jgi:colicin import membrane protein
VLRELLKHPAALVFSLVVHGILITLLVISFDWTAKPAAEAPKVDVIKAVAVDAAKVEAEVKKLKAAEQQRKRTEQARLDRLKREAEAAQRKRAAEEKRVADLKKKRAAEEAKRKAEKKRLAKLKAEQDKLQKQREAEQKRLVEAERQRKQEEMKRQKAEADRKKAEAEKRNAEQARERERQRQLAEQLEAEERKRKQQQADAAASKAVAEYTALIKQKVSRSWLKPAGNIKGLKCIVRVRVIPGGDVVSAEVTRSSGNRVFDDSVEKAVFKASPLPMPRDPDVAARMREIDFEFVPEG